MIEAAGAMRGSPLLLLSNDDGLGSDGIEAAAEALAPLGEVWIVAPDGERSSCGHAMTLSRPIFCRKVGARAFAVTGMPGDAVFVAIADILPRRPDLVVSGINHGPNLGKDVYYSGTVAAAREAAFRGIRSIAVSLVRGRDFREAARVVRRLATAVLSRRSPFPRNATTGGVLLNVNVPPGRPRGASWTRLGRREYGEHVVKRESPRGQLYYWVNGGPLRAPSGRSTDIWAVRHGRISVTPLVLDETDERAMSAASPCDIESILDD